MCGADDPATVGDALAMLDRALAALAGADAGSLPTAVQAEALRALERGRGPAHRGAGPDPGGVHSPGRV